MAFSGKMTAANHGDLLAKITAFITGDPAVPGRDWTVARQDSLEWGPATVFRNTGLAGNEEVYVGLYPNVTTALLGGVGALASLTVGGIVFGYAYNGLATTINAVKGGMLLLRGATIANTAATRGGTIAVLLNRAAHLSWAEVGKGSVNTVKSLGSSRVQMVLIVSYT